MGRPYPGHRVAVIDDDGNECPRGTPGDVALHRRDVHGERDPIFFLGYWKRDDATRDKFTGDPDDSWCRTGDTATMDADGYLWYQGRSDDVFKAAGYRIGPSEIENCLVKHAAVANAAVVPKPDAERGALVKAFVVLAPGFAASQRARRRAAGARARQARALRVPEGDRVHRRPADDDDRQGAAPRAAPARRGKSEGAAVGLTGGASASAILRCAQDGVSASRRCHLTWPRSSPPGLAAVCRLMYQRPCLTWSTCAGVSVAEPMIGLASGPANGTTTPAFAPGCGRAVEVAGGDRAGRAAST